MKYMQNKCLKILTNKNLGVFGFCSKIYFFVWVTKIELTKK